MTHAEDARLMALLTTLQTRKRRQEAMKGLSTATLQRLMVRFRVWEPRFQDGAINVALIQEELRAPMRVHAEMSLAVLGKEVIAGTDAI